MIMQNNSGKSCSCHNSSHLLIDRKTVSRLIALLLLFFFFSFVIGYFWGKRHAVATFAQKIEQESFADKIYYNTSLLYDHKTVLNETRTELTENNQENEKKDTEKQPQAIVKQEIIQKLPIKRYQAQIFGGTQKAAQQCCDRLQRNGIPVLTVKRSSKTAKGKEIQWYQVVTEPFTDKQELAIVLDAISLQEKIRQENIRIVELADNAHDHQKKGS